MEIAMSEVNSKLKSRCASVAGAIETFLLHVLPIVATTWLAAAGPLPADAASMEARPPAMSSGKGADLGVEEIARATLGQDEARH